jgi:NAD(P)-dependent dehydrogenase (short-subunit alcohol dehydrogenase family)
MFLHLTPEQVEVIRQRHPLGFGEPADVAHAVSFLLSPMAKWITGVVLPVDGGYTAQ